MMSVDNMSEFLKKKRAQQKIPEDILTWDDIYIDFRQRHPRLRKEVINWKPVAYAEIRIWLSSGMILDYDYDEHRSYVVEQGDI